MGTINQPAQEEATPQDKVGESTFFVMDKELIQKVKDQIGVDVLGEADPSVDAIRLGQQLDVKDIKGAYKSLTSILQYATENNVNKEELLGKLKEIEYKIGWIEDKNLKVKKMAQYLRLDKTIKSLINRLTTLSYGP